MKNQLLVVRLVRKKKKGSTELLLWMMLLLLAGCWVMLCVRYGVRVCPRMWDLYYNTLSVTFWLVFTTLEKGLRVRR